MSLLPLNRILFGNCLEILKGLPSNSVDSIVTDPPYGLGTKEPTGEEIFQYLRGESLDTGGDFMGKAWEIPTVETWRECYRVLKPGGHVLSFAGTRTWDIVSLGLRAAGFESRDTISQLFASPCLMFLHGQGFPKSMNIAKELDARELRCRCHVPTKEPEVAVETETRILEPYMLTGLLEQDEENIVVDVAAEVVVPDTVAETVEPKKKRAAKKSKTPLPVSDVWPMCPTCSKPIIPDGLGTALKPAWEPILCFRKPLEASTVAEQVFSTGTSEMNIDATRVRHSTPEDFAQHKAGVEAIKARGGKMADSWKNSSDLSGANDVTTAGRWPPNVVLVHSAGCRIIGHRKVDAPVINRFDDGMKPFGEGAGHPFTSEQTGDENGQEDIPIYECLEGCPVLSLDGQSGDRPSTLTGRADPMLAHKHPATARPEAFFGSLQGGIGKVYADSGGASRFFPQFVPPSAPFLYTGKATKREKGLSKFHDGFVELKEKLTSEQREQLEREWPADNRAPTEPHIEEAVPESLRPLFQPVRPEAHPTVKPIALMRWLIRLVTPKGGITIDPFCGSGTTCAAAIDEDVQFIGIDFDKMYFKLATKRIEVHLEEALDRKSQRAAFDMMDDLPQE